MEGDLAQQLGHLLRHVYPESASLGLSPNSTSDSVCRLLCTLECNE